MKLGTNIHHVSGHCSRGFQGQMSKVKVITASTAILTEACISTVWRRGSFVRIVVAVQRLGKFRVILCSRIKCLASRIHVVLSDNCIEFRTSNHHHNRHDTDHVSNWRVVGENIPFPYTLCGGSGRMGFRTPTHQKQSFIIEINDNQLSGTL